MDVECISHSSLKLLNLHSQRSDEMRPTDTLRWSEQVDNRGLIKVTNIKPACNLLLDRFQGFIFQFPKTF